MRILIADDDLTSRTILMAALQKLGHDVVAVGGGAEAWEVLQQSDAPRLAILDWVMPGLDGPEVCRRVRACETDQPPYLILLTVREAKKDISEGLHAGADDYLAKPFDALELGARIDVGSRIIALQERLAGKVRELRAALGQIRTLRGIVPICAGCKKVRDDEGYWKQVESFISAHSEATFTHSLCPECVVRLYPEYSTDGGDDGEGPDSSV